MVALGQEMVRGKKKHFFKVTEKLACDYFSEGEKRRPEMRLCSRAREKSENFSLSEGKLNSWEEVRRKWNFKST